MDAKKLFEEFFMNTDNINVCVEEEGEYENAETANVLHKLANNKVHLHLPHAKLKKFPENIYGLGKHLMFIYLEGNLLEEIPQTFFPSLLCLKWLDVRNNLLKRLPVSIANHQMLEVLLLQGNKIERLPVELGLVPKLRGLQLAGNPLVFPPQSVVASGIRGILDFLQYEWECQNSSIQPINELFYDRTSHKGVKHTRKSKSVSNTSVNKKKHEKLERPKTTIGEVPVLSVKSCSLSHPKHWLKEVNSTPGSVNQNSQRNIPQVLVIEECHRKEVNGALSKPNSVEEKIQQLWCQRKSIKISTPIADSTIQENHLRQMCVDRVQEMLEKQAAILQRRKDKEVLKTWRKDVSFQRQRSARELSLPTYGTDPNYASMKTRMEVQHDRNERKSKSAPPRKLKTIDEEISEIFEMMKHLQERNITEDSNQLSQQNMNGYETKMLSEIQKKLQRLKLKNK